MHSTLTTAVPGEGSLSKDDAGNKKPLVERPKSARRYISRLSGEI